MTGKKTDELKKTAETEATRGPLQLEQVAPPVPNADEYSRVVARAKLAVMQLTKSSFDVDPSYFARMVNTRKQTEDSADALIHGVDCSATHLAFFADNGVVSVIFNWSLNVTTDDDTQLLRLEASYLVAYHELAECDELAAKYFALKIGIFTAYPYFRAFASQMSWSSGSRLPELPVLTSENAPNVLGALLPQEPVGHPDAGTSASAARRRKPKS